MLLGSLELAVVFGLDLAGGKCDGRGWLAICLALSVSLFTEINLMYFRLLYVPCLYVFSLDMPSLSEQLFGGNMSSWFKCCGSEAV